MKTIFEQILEARRANDTVALCTIVHTRGSTPCKVGSKMLVYADGTIGSTIGGGALEKKVIMDALEVIKSRVPSLFSHDLLNQHNMCCGGTVDIFIEPIMKRNSLYIFGAGHTGQALATQAIPFDFDITLIDDRREYMDQCNLSGVNRMCMHFEDALAQLPFDEQVFICIMTYSHPTDRDILAYCLGKPFAYLGMIGSQRKVEMTKKLFKTGLGISDNDLVRVDMPMGIDIGAEGPEEIAVSILAKLIQVKHRITT